MITLIEANAYRCLKYTRQPLRGFQVLVGANASGKTTFLDTVGLCSDILSIGFDDAISARTKDFVDLIWKRKGSLFEIALEIKIPEDVKGPHTAHYEKCRYEICIGQTNDNQGVGIIKEHLKLIPIGNNPRQFRQRSIFPEVETAPESIIRSRNPKGWRKILSKDDSTANAYFMSETSEWNNPFKLGPRKSALANIPEDETKFPVATWLKYFLKEGVQVLKLNSDSMRRATPPGQPTEFRPDGSNIPYVVKALKTSEKSFNGWLKHVRTALPDLRDIKIVEREEDRHLYLKLQYSTGIEVPSWLVSDGTLRLLALTLLAYIPNISGVFLIEEPENGIHPKAIEIIYQSLSSVYKAQILLATHSPVILGVSDLANVLCFAKDNEGATDIVTGPDHPRLRNWQGEVNLGTLFASGVMS